MGTAARSRWCGTGFASSATVAERQAGVVNEINEVLSSKL